MDWMEIVHHVTESRIDVFEEWLDGLRDARTVARIVARIDRLAVGNFGDCKALQAGVWELRIDWGPGYRVYHGMASRKRVVLLCGGDKRKQSADIRRAVKCWTDYLRRAR